MDLRDGPRLGDGRGRGRGADGGRGDAGAADGGSGVPAGGVQPAAVPRGRRGARQRLAGHADARVELHRSDALLAAQRRPRLRPRGLGPALRPRAGRGRVGEALCARAAGAGRAAEPRAGGQRCQRLLPPPLAGEDGGGLWQDPGRPPPPPRQPAGGAQHLPARLRQGGGRAAGAADPPLGAGAREQVLLPVAAADAGRDHAGGAAALLHGGPAPRRGLGGLRAPLRLHAAGAERRAGVQHPAEQGRQGGRPAAGPARLHGLLPRLSHPRVLRNPRRRPRQARLAARVPPHGGVQPLALRQQAGHGLLHAPDEAVLALRRATRAPQLRALPPLRRLPPRDLQQPHPVPVRRQPAHCLRRRPERRRLPQPRQPAHQARLPGPPRARRCPCPCR
mmetsp:Transcript_4804/g.16956  ORF Transcript_4804/g.16956 Transcript_4804/m.16956 type:complete len:392 (-) Transcript_4804:72-1247(-)